MQAFGDGSTGSFLRALDRYIAEALMRSSMPSSIRGNLLLAGVRACLTGYVERTSGVGGKRAMPGGGNRHGTGRPRHRGGAAVSGDSSRRWKPGWTAALARAQAEGELVDGVEPTTVARLLLCLLEGMRVVGKASPDRRLSQAVVQTLIDRFAK